MAHTGLLIPQPHRPNKALILDGPAREIGAHEGGLGDHALPPFLLGLRARLDHPEHFLLADALDFRERDAEFRGALLASVFDGRGEGFGVVALVVPIQQILREGFPLRHIRACAGGFDGLFFVRLDGLFHLDLLGVPRALVDLGAEAAQVLRVLGVGMGEAGGAFADALVVVEALAVLFLEFLDVFVLRLWGRGRRRISRVCWVGR